MQREPLSPIALAKQRIAAYNQKDRKRGLACTITPEWYVANIYGQRCVHCGSGGAGPDVGADRRDNSVGHTPDNCQPACAPCNSKLGSMYRAGFTEEEVEAWKGAGGFAMGHAKGGAGGFAMGHAARPMARARA